MRIKIDRVFPVLLTVFLAATLLGGCSTVREALGKNKKAPDEFAVYSREPLTLPKEFKLPTPRPGDKRIREVSPRNDALLALFGRRGLSGGTAPAPTTPGIQALLNTTGANATLSDIRGVVNRESAFLKEDEETVTDVIKFWGTDTAYGTVVDPARESKRIQENLALGRPLTEGETPVMKKKREALFEGIFD
jgi:hypothetical protein